MTFKIEFPADRTDIALAIGQALTAIGQGTALVNSPEETSARTVGKAPELGAPYGAKEQKAWEEQIAGAAGASSTACDDQLKTGEQHMQGPYYWVHHESEAHGIVETWGQLQDTTREPLVEHVDKETYDKLVAEWSVVVKEVDRDPKGVAFNAEFCAKAQDPYYASGKRKNQWKKRKGVSEEAYDDWYADEMFGSKIEDSTEGNGGSNVADNTFGKGHQQAATDEDAPQDAGQLMKWVSEQQAGGNITQQQVTDAYAELKLPFDAVMNPSYPIAKNCAAIYNHLKGQI